MASRGPSAPSYFTPLFHCPHYSLFLSDAMQSFICERTVTRAPTVGQHCSPGTLPSFIHPLGTYTMPGTCQARHRARSLSSWTWPAPTRSVQP